MSVLREGLTSTKKITQAQFAYCKDCGIWLGCQYWSLSKSVGMHKGGNPQHSITLWCFS